MKNDEVFTGVFVMLVAGLFLILAAYYFKNNMPPSEIGNCLRNEYGQPISLNCPDSFGYAPDFKNILEDAFYQLDN